VQIVVPQSLDDGGDLAFKCRHILIAQIAVAGDADHQRQAVRERVHCRFVYRFVSVARGEARTCDIVASPTRGRYRSALSAPQRSRDILPDCDIGLVATPAHCHANRAAILPRALLPAAAEAA
jgi:hypothetical protein